MKTYAHHNYPGGTVTSLMSHSNIASNLHNFDADIAAALGQGKPYIFGETNSGELPGQWTFLLEANLTFRSLGRSVLSLLRIGALVRG